uniref:alpha-amylase n=1 Tax=Rhizophlyctis rosea TaxID=64517 RepID=A0A2U8U9Q6_9FUNG|nr:glycoside hydrolase family 13 [Rhizophlyctis rosea]
MPPSPSRSISALTLLLSTFLILTTHAIPSVNDWKSRTIYQIVTDRFARTDGVDYPCENLRNYCGGTWKGIQNRLDYIQYLGFDAIWISPIPESMLREEGFMLSGGCASRSELHYHRCGHGISWLLDNQPIQPQPSIRHRARVQGFGRRGASEELVLNHVGPIPIANITPFNQPNQYHDRCIINDGPQTQDRIENCRLGYGDMSLPDLNTEDANVAKVLFDWTDDTIKKYSIDGLRLDAAKHIPKPFYTGLFNQIGPVFAVGEAYEFNGTYVADYQRYMPSLQHYPFYNVILQTFESGGSMQYLDSNRTSFNNVFPDPKAMVTFVDGHDTHRFLQTQLDGTQPPGTTSDTALLQNALTFIMLSDGVPCLLYGMLLKAPYQQDAAYSRDSFWQYGYKKEGGLVNYVRALNAIRKMGGQEFLAADHTTLLVNERVMVFRKGPIIAAITNAGSGMADTPISVAVFGFGAGTEFTVIDATSSSTPTAASSKLILNSSGNLTFTIHAGQPVVMIPSQLFSPITQAATTGGQASAGSWSVSRSSWVWSAVAVGMGENAKDPFRVLEMCLGGLDPDHPHHSVMPRECPSGRNQAQLPHRRLQSLTRGYNSRVGHNFDFWLGRYRPQLRSEHELRKGVHISPSWSLAVNHTTYPLMRKQARTARQAVPRTKT